MKNKRKTSPQYAFNEFINRRFSEANQERIFLILKREENKIIDFRKEWHIPKKGFEEESEWEDWWNNLSTIIPEKVRDIEYLEFEEFYFFEGFTPVKTILSSDLEDYERKKVFRKNPQVVFDFEIQKLTRELKLDQDLNTLIREYVLFNEVNLKKVINTNIIVSQRTTIVPELGEIERKISLIFGPNASQQDLIDMYKFFIVGLQKTIEGYLKGEIQKQGAFKRNLKIITLHNQGKSASEIIKELGLEGRRLEEAYINKIIRRIEAY